MKRRLLPLAAGTILAGLLFFVGTALASQQASWVKARQQMQRARAVDGRMSAGESGAPGIRSSRRISIPYGFADNLPLMNGNTITASGHGGCSEGATVTILVTVTQAINGATGGGQTEQICTGDLQTWDVEVHADQYSTFVDGPAEACGKASTPESFGEPSTYEWCKAVRLNWQIYLPAVIE